MSKRVRRKSTGVSTLDIWPWKYLVPWMREDLFARRDNRKLRGQKHLVTNNSYDMEDMVMPLHDYINDPVARDIVHNGATFQVSQTTLIMRKHMKCVIACLSIDPSVNMSLKLAKKKLDHMLYVGLTENHKESATMFANIVGAQVISQHSESSSSKDVEANSDSEQDSDTKSDANDQGITTNQTLTNVSSTNKDGVARANLTVPKLMEAYETCISTLRSSQSERRVNSLKRISPANFTKEARRQVPEELIQEIQSLNSLDVELYNYAQHIFTKQQAHVMQNMAFAERLESTVSTSAYPSFYNSPSGKLLFLSITETRKRFKFWAVLSKNIAEEKGNESL
ncbi:protein-tyrosine sulfotransferase [Phtheirospermum japonicum]|uniref:Protein-tyrosine sulfotransferase n=1 Tax=Phtheirospermum japonicum TaxID=374723 RepID=A0A830BJX0_9LAMI|nr:protein-tyrosine sulfotransferase [Phtheirospermum japonicum]